MSTNTLKTIGTFTAICISLFALYQSNVSNNLSNKALNISQRPYVSLEPAKFENGKFISIKNSGGKVTIEFRFKISNTGNSSAQNIRTTPVAFSVLRATQENSEAVLESVAQCSSISKGIALAPGDSQYLRFTDSILMESNDASILMRQYSENELSIPFNVEVTYGADGLSTKGKTGLSLVFLPDSVTTIYSVLE